MSDEKQVILFQSYQWGLSVSIYGLAVVSRMSSNELEEVNKLFLSVVTGAVSIGSYRDFLWMGSRDDGSIEI